VLKDVFYTHKQFPVMPAFVLTIHKSHGLSLKTSSSGEDTASSSVDGEEVMLNRNLNVESHASHVTIHNLTLLKFV